MVGRPQGPQGSWALCRCERPSPPPPQPFLATLFLSAFIRDALRAFTTPLSGTACECCVLGNCLTTCVHVFSIVLASTLQDITAMAKSQRELRQVANDLEQVIEYANAPIFGIDVNGLVNEW